MDRIQLRRDSSARWAEHNPILLEGEVGYEIDTKRRKIGDGVHRWNDLEYLAAENIVQETGDSETGVMSQAAVTRELTELGKNAIFDISEYNAIDGVAKTYTSLSDALVDVPAIAKHGGMSIKYVQSSDNKYVQFRYMESNATTIATFTNTANWQGVDDEPTAGSDNLVKSGRIYADIINIENTIGANLDDSFDVSWRGSGSWINSLTGELKFLEGNNRNSTNTIPICFNKIITSASSTKFIVFFYAKDNSYIGYTGDIWITSTNYTITPLSGAVFYSIVIDETVVTSTSLLSVQSNGQGMRGDIEKNAGTLTSIMSILPFISDIVLNDGIKEPQWIGQDYAINVNNGNIGYTEGRNRNTTDKIQLSDYTKVIVSGNNKLIVCYYTASDVYLGYEDWITVNEYNFTSSQYYESALYCRLMIDTTVVTSTNNVSIIIGSNNIVKTLNKFNDAFIVVDPNGNGDYLNIVDALNNAGDTENKHVTIYVRQGTYIMPQKVSYVEPYVETGRNITILGENKNSCILQNNIGFYDYTIGTDCSTLRLNGNVVLKNLTIISNSTEFNNFVNTEGYVPRDNYRKAAYCVHRDLDNNPNTKFVVDNCVFINDHFVCFGFGLKPNTEIVLIDTYFQSEQASENSSFNDYGTIYGHYKANDVGLNQNISVIRCQFVNKTSYQAINIMSGMSQSATPEDTFGHFKFIQNAVNTTDPNNSLVFMVDSSFYEIDALSFGNRWD